MPTYTYRCPKCGHEFDKLQRISDRTRAKCPRCGTRGERKITGGGGVHFKGSGFYITDYKRKQDTKQKQDAPEKPDTAPAKKPDAPKSDSPPKAAGADS